MEKGTNVTFPNHEFVPEDEAGEFHEKNFVNLKYGTTYLSTVSSYLLPTFDPPTHPLVPPTVCLFALRFVLKFNIASEISGT